MKNEKMRQFVLRLGVATIALMSATSTHSARAVQKVSDVELAAQTGGARYYTGPCDKTNGRYICVPVDDQCHVGGANDLNTGDDYFIKVNSKPYCLGTPVTNPGPTSCDNEGVSYITVYREWHNRTAGQECGSGELIAPETLCTHLGCK